MGACYQNLDMPWEAVQVYELILQEHPSHHDVKLSLAEVYEELNERDKALDLVNEVLVARSELREGPAESSAQGHPDGNVIELEAPASLSFFNESALGPSSGTSQGASRAARSNMTFVERQRLEQQREEETRLAWVQLCALEPKVFVDGFWRHDFVFLDGPIDADSASSSHADSDRFEATRQWIKVAGRLIDSFRSMSLLFPKERYTKYRGVLRQRRTRRINKPSDLDSQAEELLSRLRDQMVDEAVSHEDDVRDLEQTTFRTIHFDDWISLFMKYGIALAKVGGEDDAIHEMFQHVMVSNTVWPSEERKMALHLAWLGTYTTLTGSMRTILS